MTTPKPSRAKLDSAIRTIANQSNRLTSAERQRRYRAAQGNRFLRYTLTIEAAAALLYLRKQWGFKSNYETTMVCLRYLAVQTRKGLQRIDLTID